MARAGNLGTTRMVNQHPLPHQTLQQAMRGRFVERGHLGDVDQTQVARPARCHKPQQLDGARYGLRGISGRAHGRVSQLLRKMDAYWDVRRLLRQKIANCSIQFPLSKKTFEFVLTLKCRKSYDLCMVEKLHRFRLISTSNTKHLVLLAGACASCAAASCAGDGATA